MDRCRSRKRAPALIALLWSIALVAAVAVAPAAAKPRAAKLEVAKVGTSSIDLRWSGGAKAKRWALRHRAGGDWTTLRIRGSRRARLAGLDRGSVQEAQVAPCRRGRCRPWSNTVRTATLLAPINGPHPDPGCATFPPGDELNRDVSGAAMAGELRQIIAQIEADGGDALHPDFGSPRAYGFPYVGRRRRPAAAADPLHRLRRRERPGAASRFRRARRSRAATAATATATCSSSTARRRPARSTSSTAPSRRRSRGRTGTPTPGADWDLRSAPRRPDGWTSADAAGLPIFPGLVRYDEVAAGHDRPRDPGHLRAAPATPGSTPPPTAPATPANPTAPPMGLRLRLKARLRQLGGFSGAARAIAVAMKRYGLIVADNGSNWYFSGTSDRRWDDDEPRTS